ncbi:hypothetical protein LptCag_2606 [Leptospirillum ferriphilum]|uniref:Uncharacterized protein n=1 Tax=Leptospirillum ferriphilum TaxID=178606 RepID=A0A094WHK3_9BACT|nr:hypothetical protein LptCag_2606 [Leptospirillum ferriphilum]
MAAIKTAIRFLRASWVNHMAELPFPFPGNRISGHGRNG